MPSMPNPSGSTQLPTLRYRRSTPACTTKTASVSGLWLVRILTWGYRTFAKFGKVEFDRSTASSYRAEQFDDLLRPNGDQFSPSAGGGENFGAEDREKSSSPGSTVSDLAERPVAAFVLVPIRAAGRRSGAVGSISSRVY